MNPGKLPAPMQQINLGIIGGGTVGGGVFQAIQRNGALISSRLGARLHIAKMVVRDVRKPRSVKIPSSLLTTNWAGVVNDPRINLIVELMGGVTTAREGSSRRMAKSCLPRRNAAAQTSTTKPVSPAAFPSSKCCAKD